MALESTPHLYGVAGRVCSRGRPFPARVRDLGGIQLFIQGPKRDGAKWHAVSCGGHRDGQIRLWPSGRDFRARGARCDHAVRGRGLEPRLAYSI